MTIKELEKLIEDNTESAENGCGVAQGIIVNAESEIERMKWEWSRAVRSASMDNQDHAWRSRERNWGIESEHAWLLT